MKKIAVIYGSSRSSNVGRVVADWFVEKAGQVEGTSVDMLDLSEQNLPLFDEPAPPMSGQKANEHTKKWSNKIDGYDGFIMVVAEYNHGYTPILKNAIDYLLQEWAGKPVGFVGYGGGGAKYAIDQLRAVLEHMKMKPAEGVVGVNQVWQAISPDGKVDESLVVGDPKQLLQDVSEKL